MIFVPVRPEWDIGRVILSGLCRPDTPSTLPGQDRGCPTPTAKGFLSMSVNTRDSATSAPVVRSRLLEAAPGRSGPSLLGERHRRQAGRPIGSKHRTDSPAPDRPRPTHLRRNTGHDPPPEKPAIRHFPGCGKTGPDRRETTSRGSKTRPPAPNHPEHIRISAPAARRSLPPRNERRRSINAPRPSSPRRRIRR